MRNTVRNRRQHTRRHNRRSHKNSRQTNLRQPYKPLNRYRSHHRSTPPPNVTHHRQYPPSTHLKPHTEKTTNIPSHKHPLEHRQLKSHHHHRTNRFSHKVTGQCPQPHAISVNFDIFSKSDFLHEQPVGASDAFRSQSGSY